MFRIPCAGTHDKSTLRDDWKMIPLLFSLDVAVTFEVHTSGHLVGGISFRVVGRGRLFEGGVERKEFSVEDDNHGTPLVSKTQ